MGNIALGIVSSYVFIFVGIVIAGLGLKYNSLSDEGSRKFIHIYVGNWWLLAMVWFDSVWAAGVVPLTFVVINYISYKKQLFKAMERSIPSKNDLGTVYYALALVVLTLVTFWDNQYAYIGGIGILVMAYGDGLAAVIGKKYGKKWFKSGEGVKSLEGSLTMFVASLLVVAIMIGRYTDKRFGSLVGISFVVAMVATALEAWTPNGYDNLSVPLGTSVVSFLMIYGI